MEFCNYLTSRDVLLREHPRDARRIKAATVTQLYASLAAALAAEGDAETRGFGPGQMELECNWEVDRRPYYNVWPSVVPLLTRLRLDIDGNLIRPPCRALCVRLPAKATSLTLHAPNGGIYPVRCILMGEANVRVTPGDMRDTGRGMSVFIDFGEVVPGTRIPFYSYRFFPLRKGMTIEECLAKMPICPSAHVSLDITPDVTADCMRLCCTLCLLDNDPSVISPEVLSDDMRRFDETGDQKLVEKARRRGKIGWSVGRHIEMIPHCRRPHPALVWTGHGRAIPKIVMRKGSIVHREVVERVPTGIVVESE